VLMLFYIFLRQIQRTYETLKGFILG